MNFILYACNIKFLIFILFLSFKKYLSSPIIGDDKYFLNDRKIIKTKSLMLHAYKIKFMINNVQYNFKAKYNEAFEYFLNKNF